MRAAYITELGPAEAIRVGDLPVPVPGPTDVLVRVEVVVVNPVDILVRSGTYPTPTRFPFVVGRDLERWRLHDHRGRRNDEPADPGRRRQHARAHAR